MTIETKYNQGETVCFMRDNMVRSGTVIGITTRVGNYERDKQQQTGTEYYLKCDGFDSGAVPENKIFKTKEALLQSL